jgi:hypothetical protein
VKNVKTVSGFKRKYKIHRELVASPRGKKIWRQDGGMEHNTRKTLPERSQRDYWEFITKYQVNK